MVTTISLDMPFFFFPLKTVDAWQASMENGWCTCILSPPAIVTAWVEERPDLVWRIFLWSMFSRALGRDRTCIRPQSEMSHQNSAAVMVCKWNKCRLLHHCSSYSIRKYNNCVMSYLDTGQIVAVKIAVYGIEMKQQVLSRCDLVRQCCLHLFFLWDVDELWRDVSVWIFYTPTFKEQRLDVMFPFFAPQFSNLFVSIAMNNLSFSSNMSRQLAFCPHPSFSFHSPVARRAEHGCMLVLLVCWFLTRVHLLLVWRVIKFKPHHFKQPRNKLPYLQQNKPLN